MSNVPKQQDRDDKLQGVEEEKGPNLTVIYVLLAVGLLLAAGIAAMVVWPFYLRR